MSQTCGSHITLCIIGSWNLRRKTQDFCHKLNTTMKKANFFDKMKLQIPLTLSRPMQVEMKFRVPVRKLVEKEDCEKDRSSLKS